MTITQRGTAHHPARGTALLRRGDPTATEAYFAVGWYSLTGRADGEPPLADLADVLRGSKPSRSR